MSCNIGGVFRENENRAIEVVSVQGDSDCDFEVRKEPKSKQARRDKMTKIENAAGGATEMLTYLSLKR